MQSYKTCTKHTCVPEFVFDGLLNASDNSNGQIFPESETVIRVLGVCSLAFAWSSSVSGVS